MNGARHIQTEPLMHLYRHTTLSFLPINLNKDNLFEDQCSQMVLLEKQVSSLKFLFYEVITNCKQLNLDYYYY